MPGRPRHQCACSNCRRSLRTPPVNSADPIGTPGHGSMSPNSRSASFRICSGIDLAARRQDQPPRHQLVADPVEAIVARGGAQGLGAAENRAAQRLPVERRFEQMIVNQVVGRIDDLAELGQDHVLLALEMLLADVRRADQVGDQFREERGIPGQGAPVEDGLVARGPGVDRPADILDRLGQSARVARPRALEHHMLDEMREAATDAPARSASRPSHRARSRPIPRRAAGRPQPRFRCQVGEARRSCSRSLLLQPLAQRQAIDDQRDCSQAEPGCRRRGDGRSA